MLSKLSYGLDRLNAETKRLRFYFDRDAESASQACLTLACLWALGYAALITASSPLLVVRAFFTLVFCWVATLGYLLGSSYFRYFRRSRKFVPHAVIEQRPFDRGEQQFFDLTLSILQMKIAAFFIHLLVAYFHSLGFFVIDLLQIRPWHVLFFYVFCVPFPMAMIVSQLIAYFFEPYLVGLANEIREVYSFACSFRRCGARFLLEQFSPQGEEVSEKDFARLKFMKHKSGRLNKKEARVRAIRAARRINRMANEQIEAQKGLQIDPHAFGEDFVSFVGNLSAFVKSYEGEEADAIVRHAENVLLLAYNLHKSRSTSDIFVAIVCYMKMYAKKSLSGTIVTMLEVFVEDNSVEITEDAVVNDVCTPHALSGRDVLDAWTLVKSNDMYSKLSYLLCAAMSCSICSIKEIDWSIAGVQIIKAEAMKETAHAVDLIDAVIHTFTWISETGWWCIKERSLAPLLYSDQRLRKYYEDCSEVIAYADSAKAGNIEDMNEYLRKLNETLETTSKMQALASKAMKEVLQRKYAILINIKQDMIAKGKNTQFRFAPFGVSISGESSIGKSNLAELTMKHALCAMGFSDAKEGIITLCEADKHDNTYTTDVVGVHIDDAANVKADFVDQAPSRKYLTFFNNVAAQAIKAELNEKGCVFINFKCGVITTNVKDLDARVYSNYPMAILRRFVHVSARVKPRFRRSGGTSLDTDHPELVNCDENTIADVWEFDIEEAIPGKQGYHCYTAEIDGKPVLCKNLGLRDYLLALTYLAKKHAKKQHSEVARNRVLEKTKCCATCNMLPQMCRCALTSDQKHAAEYLDKGAPIVGDSLVSPESGCTRIGYCSACQALHLKPVQVPDDGFPYCKEVGWNACEDCEESLKMARESCGIAGCRNVKYSQELSGNLQPHGLVERVVTGVVLESIVKGLRSIQATLFPPLSEVLLSLAETVPVRILRAKTEEYLQRQLPFFMRWMPSSWYNSEFFQSVLKKEYTALANIDMLAAQKVVFRGYFWLFFPMFYTGGWFAVTLWLLLCSALYAFLECQMENSLLKYQLALEHHRDSLGDYGKQLRDESAPKILRNIGISLAAIGMVLLAWQMSRRNSIQHHGITEEQIRKHDEAPGWFGVMMNSMRLSMNNTTVPTGATPNQVLETISNNTAWGQFTSPDFENPLSCGVFFPRKSVMLFPRHMLFSKNDMNGKMADKVSCTITRSDKPGGKFTVAISPEMCYHFPDMDLVGAYVPNSPDFATKTQWLPDVLPRGQCMGHILVPNKAGDKQIGSVSPKFGQVSHTFSAMYGATYNTPLARKGACMSPIVNEGKNPCIVGFHIGGDASKNVGICQTLIKSDFATCCEWLDKHAGFLSAEATDLPVQQMGVDIKSSDEVHPKALFIQSLDSDAFVDLHGSTKLRSEQKSRVQPSLMSKDIEEVCHVPQQWGKPCLKPNWDAFNVNVSQFVRPAMMFLPRLLRRAQLDWETPLLAEVRKYCVIEDFRPLTMKETILGIPGKKYVDPFPMNTGMGFPLFGRKDKTGENGEYLYFEEIRDGEILIDRIPKKIVMDEFNRLLACWKAGKRAYPVTSATLKDEPTRIGKKKVRVFQAAPVALSLAIRMYFLPIARFLHLHPHLTESAVGINSFSRDWKKLINHMHKYSGNGARMLGWDYKQYDVRMNSQLVRAAWESFIHIAEAGGYADEDIHIMKNMIADICHPLMDMNGTLLMAYNMNTSGNNMTVDVNGTVGSFLVRMGFFHTYPNAEDFRSAVALMTYGDDAGGSVVEEFQDFNFTTFKKFLADHDMQLTLPDKSEDDRAFLKPEEADFIKRISSYIPEIDEEIGKLDENSIFKSLHSNLKSSVATEREVAASCIETALHEWFAFGRNHYEERRAQMQEVASRHALDIPALNISFDERVSFWLEKYPKE